jgi:hypothetical protein
MPRVGELNVWTFLKVKFGSLRILFGGFQEDPVRLILISGIGFCFFFAIFFLPYLAMNFDKQQ